MVRIPNLSRLMPLPVHPLLHTHTEKHVRQDNCISHFACCAPTTFRGFEIKVIKKKVTFQLKD